MSIQNFKIHKNEAFYLLFLMVFPGGSTCASMQKSDARKTLYDLVPFWFAPYRMRCRSPQCKKDCRKCGSRHTHLRQSHGLFRADRGTFAYKDRNFGGRSAYRYREPHTSVGRLNPTPPSGREGDHKVVEGASGRKRSANCIA